MKTAFLLSALTYAGLRAYCALDSAIQAENTAAVERVAAYACHKSNTLCIGDDTMRAARCAPYCKAAAFRRCDAELKAGKIHLIPSFGRR